MTKQWAVIAELGEHPIIDTPAALQRLADNFRGPIPVIASPSGSGYHVIPVACISWIEAVRIDGARLLGRLTRVLDAREADCLRVSIQGGGTDAAHIVDVALGRKRDLMPRTDPMPLVRP